MIDSSPKAGMSIKGYVSHWGYSMDSEEEYLSFSNYKFMEANDIEAAFLYLLSIKDDEDALFKLLIFFLMFRQMFQLL